MSAMIEFKVAALECAAKKQYGVNYDKTLWKILIQILWMIARKV